MVNYYEVLQIHTKADQAVIRAAYRALMKELGNHPDHGGNLKDAQRINEAYENLIDPQKRRLVDRQWNKSANTASKPQVLVRCSQCKTLNKVAHKTNKAKCGRCGALLSLETRRSSKINLFAHNLIKNLRKNGWSMTKNTAEGFHYSLQNDFFLKNYIHIKKVDTVTAQNIHQITQEAIESYKKQILPVGHYFVILADKMEYISYIIHQTEKATKEMNSWSFGLIIPVDLSRRQVFLPKININNHPADIVSMKNYIFN